MEEDIVFLVIKSYDYSDSEVVGAFRDPEKAWEVAGIVAGPDAVRKIDAYVLEGYFQTWVNKVRVC